MSVITHAIALWLYALRLRGRGLSREERFPLMFDRAVSAAERLGGAFVKLAQLVALMPMARAPDVAARCRRLLDSAKPLPTRRARRIAERHARAIGDALIAFDPTPLGSASVAVVHRVELRDRGRVVLKIRRPNARRRLLGDVLLLSPLRLKGAEAAEMHRVLRRTAMAELNFRAEAAAMCVAAAQFAETDGRVRVPSVVPADCSASVLVMSEVVGTPVDHVRDPSPALVDAIASFSDSWFRHALRGEVFHADLHPANVLADDEGTLWVLDWGQTGKLNPEVAQALCGTLVAERVTGEITLAEAHSGLREGDHVVDTANGEEAMSLWLFLKSIFQLTSWASALAPNVVVATQQR